jgi:hypothetical protein
MKKILILALTLIVSFASFGQGKFVGDGSFQGTGDYPITRFGYAQTGYYPMVRTTQRDSIPTWQRTYGMLVYCSATDSTYILTDVALGNTWTAFKFGSGGGVSSFNSRTGAVVPLVGDYSSFYKGVADSFFVTGFTTRGRTKQIIDSLGAAKQNVLTNPITGSLTSGRIPFATGTTTLGDNSGLTWNNTSQTFAIASPTDGATAPLTINAARNGGYAFTYLNSTSNQVDARIINVLGSNGNGWGDWGVSGDGTTNILTQMYFRTPTSAPINFLTNGTNRMVIGGDGRILTNGATNNGVDNVQVNGSLIATTLKSTTNTVSGNSTIDGTLGVTGATNADGGVIANGNVYQPLIIRRATNTLGAAVEVPFQMLNASSVYAPYAHIRSYIVANTAGSQSGGLRFSTYNAGADETQLEISNTGAITASNLAGTGTRAVEASSTGVLSATKIIDAGTYTPTLGNFVGTSSRTLNVASYSRIGDIVTVTVLFTYVSTANGYNAATITIPVGGSMASNSAAGAGNGTSGIIFNRISSNGTTVLCEWQEAVSGSEYDISVTFQYRVQ